MITLIHSPFSRSTRILSLIEEMGIADQIETKIVDIVRFDGTGRRDPANPHPDQKVPALIHNGELITESVAIMVYLTTLFPDTGLAPAPGTAEWGRFLAWMAWYAAMMEPALILSAAGLQHPYLTSTFRGPDQVTARLQDALSKGPWIMGEQFTAADILLHSPYAWFKDATPDNALIRDWVARCQARPALLRARSADQARMAA